LDFGPVQVGDTKSTILNVRNDGAMPLAISGASTSSGEFDVNPSSALVAPSTNQDFTLTIHPGARGTTSGTVSFVHNGIGPNSIPLSGQGIDPIVLSDWAWQNPTPQGNFLNGIACRGADTAIAVGDLGGVVMTSDGGATWSVRHYAGGTTNSLNG